MVKEEYSFHMSRKTMKEILAYKEQVAEGLGTKTTTVENVCGACLLQVIWQMYLDQIGCVNEKGKANELATNLKPKQLKLLAEFVVGMSPEEFFHCLMGAASSFSGSESEKSTTSWSREEQSIFDDIQIRAPIGTISIKSGASIARWNGTDGNVYIDDMPQGLINRCNGVDVYVDDVPLNKAVESRWGIGIWAGLTVANILPGFILIVLGISFTATGFGASVGVPLICSGAALCGIGALSGVKVFDVAGVTIDTYKPKYLCLESLPKDERFAQKHPCTYIFTPDEIFYSDGQTVEKISIEAKALRKKLGITTEVMNTPKVLSGIQLQSITLSGHDYRLSDAEKSEQKAEGSTTGVLTGLGGAVGSVSAPQETHLSEQPQSKEQPQPAKAFDDASCFSIMRC